MVSAAVRRAISGVQKSARLVASVHQRPSALTVAAVMSTQQSSCKPRVAVAQMTAVGDQLSNFNTCKKLAQVKGTCVLALPSHAV